jgi:hypothetical protein
MMGYKHTHISAAPVGDANGFLTSVDMKVGAYVLNATAPTFGARHVTCTRTRDGVGGTDDTPGTLVVVGKDLAGSTITETLTVSATSTTVVTGTKFFAKLTSVTGAGWEVDAGAGKDKLEVGWDAECAVATGSGTLHGIVINTTAAGIITISDSGGTIAVIPVSVADGTFYEYDANYSGFLRVEPAAASDITILHSGSLPSSYSM